MAAKKQNAETLLCNNIKATLNKLPGVRCWRNSVMTGRMPSGGFYHAGLPRGSSDLIICVEGKLLCAEVKVPGKEAEKHQLEFGAEVASAGGVYVVVHSIKEAVEAVDKLRNVVK